MNISSLIGHVVELLKLSEQSSQPLDRISSTFFRERHYLGAKDRRFISEHLYNIVRHRRLAEALLERLVEEFPNFSELDDRYLRYISLYVIYTGAVEQQDKSPNELQSLIPSSYWSTHFPNINLSDTLSWVQKNRSLEFLPDDRVIRLGVKYSFQDWMVREWIADDGELLLAALNSPGPITLRVNTMKVTREECRLRLRAEGVETEPTKFSPAGLVAAKRFNAQACESFKDGWFEFQDEGSQMVSLIVHPAPENIIIDACAGAGGKSLHLAELMKDRGEIIAVDVDHRRLQELQQRANRAGLHSIKTIQKEMFQPENFFGKADIVLVDAPCSGVGTIRRNPSLKWSVSESLVEHHSEQQLDLLQENARYVKQGGRLIYVTCSLFKKENELVVEQFLGSEMGSNFAIDERRAVGDLLIEPHGGYYTLYPHRHQTDGFFIAPLKRLS